MNIKTFLGNKENKNEFFSVLDEIYESQQLQIVYLLSSLLFCGKYKQRCLEFCKKHKVLEGSRTNVRKNLFMSLSRIKGSDEYLKSLRGFKWFKLNQ